MGAVSCRESWLFGFALLCVALATACSAASSSASARELGGLEHRGQKIFLSGMNLAWINFGRDLESFDEATFVRALDEISASGGNALRWWLHTNGSQTPTFGEDGKVTGISQKALVNLRRALDLAAERGIGVIMCLWSFDMLQRQTGVNAVANREMVENPEYTRAYIDNALVPMVRALKDHPAIYAWEVCNEPEGMSDLFGWTPMRIKMKYIQQFVNLISGAIHREAPGAKVTCGTWSFIALSDVDGFTNYYRDDRLIAAGGDEQGTLDFYQVHYYPQGADERTSPFHHAASYWELDKPILIGEFPAKGIVNFGAGFRPKTPLTTTEAYRWAIENGYIGALAWTWTNHDGNGGIPEAGPAMSNLKALYADLITLRIPRIDQVPRVQSPLPPVSVEVNAPPIPECLDLRDVFYDREDRADLVYRIVGNTNPALVSASLASGSKLGLSFAPNSSGEAVITLAATDAAGQETLAELRVFVVDPERDNLALGKPVKASSIEGGDYLAAFANDGDPKTRWSSQYADDQWLEIDLGRKYEVGRVVLQWETAFGRRYRILVSADAERWQVVHKEAAGDGGVDDVSFAPVRARFVRLDCQERGTQWGFSIWECAVFRR